MFRIHIFPNNVWIFFAENSMFAFNKSAVIEYIPGASPFFNLLIASLASQKVGFI